MPVIEGGGAYKPWEKQTMNRLEKPHVDQLLNKYRMRFDHNDRELLRKLLVDYALDVYNDSKLAEENYQLAEEYTQRTNT